MRAFARLANRAVQLSISTPEPEPKNPESNLECWICSSPSPIAIAVIGQA